MVSLAQLWLPILVSAAAVWIASAIVWMALPHHSKDFIGLPDEDAFMDFLRRAGINKGNFGFPYCADKAQYKDPAFQKKWEEGPCGFLTVLGKFSMGRNMILTFVVFLVVSLFIAYLGAVALPRGAGFREVFRFLGAAGILAYAFAFLPNGIWFGQAPRAILNYILDGIGYGVVTGLVFAWLWPA